MTTRRFWVFILASMTACALSSYKIEGGESFVGAGLGANVNVVRYDVARKETPRGQLPLAITYDYAIDRNFGVFGTFVPHFGAGSVAMQLSMGAKYWFSYFDAPYVPYLSLALTPTFLVPTGVGVRHTNIGITPGVGVNFFVMADFLVGAHVNFNPSIAIVGDEKKFEFSVNAMFDVTFRI